jgi:dienelactone hydrolase
VTRTAPGYDRGVQRLDVGFPSGEETCAAWLYLPDGDGRVPGVVLAHGWTGVREQRLDTYAERFVAAGLAALVFDYRHFGASSGEPRQLLDIKRQLADWAAAIAFVRSRAEIDPERVALWGTSFSGGHVIESAAQDPRVAAVVAQVPFTDGLRNLPSLGLALAVRLVAAGVRDQLGALLGRPPHMVPSVGPPGSVAVMTTPDAEPGFRAIDPPGSTWRNEAAARVALRVGSYRPGRHAGQIAAPTLFALAQDDAITPTALAQAAAARAPNAEVHTYPGGHFDIYVGATFERAVADQVEFFTRHLLLS